MKSLPSLGRLMMSVAIIIPVKDEEVGLQYLLDNYKKSKFYEDSNISFILTLLNILFFGRLVLVGNSWVVMGCKFSRSN